jgi:hypothetical protein
LGWKFKKMRKGEEKERTRIALGLPIAQRLTLWSSPPVTRTLDDLRPILRQLTAEACATNSSKHNVSRLDAKFNKITESKKQEANKM